MQRNLLLPKRDELTGEWRRLYKEELLGLYSLSDIIRVIKSRTMRLAGHVACMGDRKDAKRVLILILTYLLTSVGLTLGGSTVQYTITHKQYIEQHN